MKPRHWIVLVLLLIAPLQFSWAAISAYCMHESGAAARHLGHHDHQHAAGIGGDTSPDPAKSGGLDPDCGACHAHFTPLPASVTLYVGVTFADRGRWLAHDLYASPPVPRPERPKWIFLA